MTEHAAPGLFPRFRLQQHFSTNNTQPLAILESVLIIEACGRRAASSHSCSCNKDASKTQVVGGDRGETFRMSLANWRQSDQNKAFGFKICIVACLQMLAVSMNSHFSIISKSNLAF